MQKHQQIDELLELKDLIEAIDRVKIQAPDRLVKKIMKYAGSSIESV